MTERCMCGDPDCPNCFPEWVKEAPDRYEEDKEDNFFDWEQDHDEDTESDL